MMKQLDKIANIVGYVFIILWPMYFDLDKVFVCAYGITLTIAIFVAHIIDIELEYRRWMTKFKKDHQIE